MTNHVFYYKFPKIKVDLVHETTELSVLGLQHGVHPEAYPKGSYLHTEDGWYQKTATYNYNRVNENHVPKEIRLHLLLLT